MFYDRFEYLCKLKRISPTRAVEEMKLARTIATKWKKTGATPRGDTIKIIAAYFGVSESYLLQDENDQLDKDNELTEELQILKNNPDTKALLYAGKHLKPEQIRQFAELMKSIPEEK